MAAPSAERWAVIEPVLDRALDLAPEHRAAFLAGTCSTDPALRLEVERLLEATELADGLIEDSAAALASPVVARVARHQAFAPGERLGAFEIERELGRGGMATVYLAHDPKHGRRVAVKVLRPELSGALGAERFAREIAIVARLGHPHILPLHDSGALELDDGAPLLFYAMPYVAGRSLRERLRREPQLPLEEAFAITRQVADALDYAHREGIVHRDIKPENILLAGRGQAVVADFGIARAIDAASSEQLTTAGLALGTPAYMSPEQAVGGDRVDGRADVYALGCVAYEMLAGEPPFTGPTAQAVMARHAVDPVPSLRTVRAAVPVHVESAINRALAKVPADRFMTAGEFATALSAPAPPRAAHRRVPGQLVVGAAAAAIVAAGLTYAVRRSPPAPPANRQLVAILPFRVAGSTPEFGWLREGMVDLLTAKLTGEGPLRAAEPAAVLNMARRVAGTGDQEIAPAGELEIGRRLGAGRVIDGSVVGTAGRATLIASLLASPGGRSLAHASVEGPVDSLAALVDRLAGQLLALDGGVDASRLPSLTSSSLPAIRAFVAGRAAFRRGRLDEAFRRYREATVVDSTFALAALELVHASYWVAIGSDDYHRGQRLAAAGRDRLGSADRALLDAWSGSPPTAPDVFRRWQAAAEAYPDRAEMWYGLGDAYYHWGTVAGLDHPIQLASAAFQRGWAIDSAGASDSLAPERSPIFAEPLIHMVEIAQMRGDTASLRRLVELGLAADSTGPSGWYLRWHLAAVLGDSARRAFWADSARIDPGALLRIAGFCVWTGVAPEDYMRATGLAVRHDDNALLRYWVAMNTGRPREAQRAVEESPDSTNGLVQRIRDALYWGADTAAAADAARRLARYADATSFTGEDAGRRLSRFIGLAEWRTARGDYAYAERASRTLRAAHIAALDPNESVELNRYAKLTASLFEATRATMLRLPDALAKLAQADAAARTIVIVQHSGPAANLIIASLAERQGDLPLALAAVRRRMTGFELGPWYLSTFLREEGRLAALAGDTAGAVRAYRHYLALRMDPEPDVRVQDDTVRTQLARLMGQP